MKRRTAAGLALLAEVLAGMIPQGLVLCVHEDGRMALEASGRLCCETGGDHATEEASGPPGLRSGSGPSPAGCDTCTDIALAARDADSQDRGGPVQSPPPPVMVTLAGCPASLVIELHGGAKPRPPGHWPPSGPPDSVESIVLRC